jgi:hypothetical protein
VSRGQEDTLSTRSFEECFAIAVSELSVILMHSLNLREHRLVHEDTNDVIPVSVTLLQKFAVKEVSLGHFLPSAFSAASSASVCEMFNTLNMLHFSASAHSSIPQC